ncbi:hypothetical protein GCM10009730_66440 [Streptomyces albidochromogenes]
MDAKSRGVLPVAPHSHLQSHTAPVTLSRDLRGARAMGPGHRWGESAYAPRARHFDCSPSSPAPRADAQLIGKQLEWPRLHAYLDQFVAPSSHTLDHPVIEKLSIAAFDQLIQTLPNVRTGHCQRAAVA